MKTLAKLRELEAVAAEAPARALAGMKILAQDQPI